MSKDKRITNPEEVESQEDAEVFEQEYAETEPVEEAKNLFFFPNLGNPFSVESSSAKEAEAANTQYLEQSKKEEK